MSSDSSVDLKDAYTIKRIRKLFETKVTRSAILNAEQTGKIPEAQRIPMGSSTQRVWSSNQLPVIGEKYGFLKHLDHPSAICVFTTKGGALKTTVAYNIARLYALHNIKTVVVGLDIQMDSTIAHTRISFRTLKAFREVTKDLQSVEDLFSGKVDDVYDLILNTNLPTLSIIPENSKLDELSNRLDSINFREKWLKENVIDPLKEEFELIIMDCSCNWSSLVVNALYACDLLVSPLECKVNNYNNFIAYMHKLRGFEDMLGRKIPAIYLPTKYVPSQKLSSDIRNWYGSEIEECSRYAINETRIGEQCMAMRKSMQEFNPSHEASREMKRFILEMHNTLQEIHSGSSRFNLPVLNNDYIGEDQPRVN